MPACSQLSLQFGEIGASLMDNHHLAIDDGFARYGERAGNLGKALRPIQPVACEYLLSSAVEMDLDAIAIVLDLVKPLVALRRFGLQRGKLGLNEPRHLDTLWHSGNSQTPAAPWGQRRAFYLLPANPEQSGG